eukprot:scaffold35496_cov60-Cyclotella_meneghiniana.AAC.1
MWLARETQNCVDQPSGYDIASVYHVAFGEPLAEGEGARDSLVNTMVQARICKEKRVAKCIDKTKAVVPIDQVWKCLHKEGMNENEQLGHLAASRERITNAFDHSSNDTNSWEAEAPEMSIRTRQVVSIAHDDIVAGRIRYVHVDIQYSQGDSKIQISAVVLGAYHNEVGKFNEFVPSDSDGPLSTSMPINEGSGGDAVGLGWRGLQVFSLHRCQVWSTAAWYASGPQKHRSVDQPSGYDIASVYHVAFGEPLAEGEGARDSLVNTMAQARICKEKRVAKCIDKTKAVVPIDQVWKCLHKEGMNENEELGHLAASRERSTYAIGRSAAVREKINI